MTKNTLYTIGAILTAIGIIGLFNNPLFGVFPVDTTLNIIHIITGLLTLGAATADVDSAQTFSKVFAAIYGIIFILGIASTNGTVFGVMVNDNANNVLHIILAAIYLYAGYAQPAEGRIGHNISHKV